MLYICYYYYLHPNIIQMNNNNDINYYYIIIEYCIAHAVSCWDSLNELEYYLFKTGTCCVN
jgi:hypothetical protein